MCSIKVNCKKYSFYNLANLTPRLYPHTEYTHLLAKHTEKIQSVP